MDATEAVAVELGRRARRARAAAGGAMALVGIAVGAVAYVMLRAYFIGRLGMNSPAATGTLTVLPCLAAALWAARPLGAGVVAARTPSWVDELASRYAIDRRDVEELATVLVAPKPSSR